ncbi:MULTISPECIES: siderophore-iron reductase FhuF [unclassified Pseudoalteromonas]|uniref:siderophore-iron reductase FhuF n=1 Tax=unclassified Pseudoalteromonas TaxID=194690 RepID=UPI002097E0AC|nr:siderophore-iron reductase FhuF [Pseudoalteromonas sp. XMcav2-N]MCO7190712.1 siderophore-iron reductase FhuF [Pseudoalteromonas sp. XMcav2-N]
MLPTLQPFFQGPFSEYGDAMALSQSQSEPTLAQCLDERGLLATAITGWAHSQGVAAGRAQASIWHMLYTIRVMPSVLLSHSVLMRPLPLSTHSVRLCLTSQRLMLAHCGEISPLSGDTDSRYHALIFGHFAPLHHYLNEQFGIAERVLWSSLVYRLNHLSKTIAEHLPNPSQLNQDVHWLLHTQQWRGKRNPLFKAHQKGFDVGAMRVRGDCCLMHEHPVKGYCDDCPKRPEHMNMRASVAKSLSQ